MLENKNVNGARKIKVIQREHKLIVLADFSSYLNQKGCQETTSYHVILLLN